MSAGGGGWGNPFDRPIDLVLEDVENLKISREAAKQLYGIEILPNGDTRETQDRLHEGRS
jgi:N-methylhydantoinase B